MLLTNYNETEEYNFAFFLLIISQNVGTDVYLKNLPVKYLFSATNFFLAGVKKKNFVQVANCGIAIWNYKQYSTEREKNPINPSHWLPWSRLHFHQNGFYLPK